MPKIKVEEHGVAVAVKRTKKDLFIELTVAGKLTHDDYMVFIPVVEKALKEAKGLKVNLLIDMTAFKGWKELKAMVDDAKFGMKHLNEQKVGRACHESMGCGQQSEGEILQEQRESVGVAVEIGEMG